LHPEPVKPFSDAHFVDGFFNEYNPCIAIPASAGTLRHRCTSAQPTPSTKPAKPPTNAYHANPARFGRRPTPPKRDTIVYINEPEPQPQPQIN
jgi:putative transposase